MRFARSFVRLGVLGALALGWPSPGLVHAQAAAQNDAQSAIALGRDAKQRFDRGELAEALGLFEAAERKAHSPVLVLYIARCQRGLGRLLEARASYRRAASEPVDVRSPEPFRNAVSEASRELGELERELPRLSIRQSALPPDAVVLVDGVRLDAAARRGLVEVDPGLRVIVALRGEQELVRVEAQAEVGSVTTVELTPAPAGVAPGPTRDPRPVAPRTPEPVREPGSLWPGVVITGVGLVGLGIGVSTRIAAFGIVDDVESRCVEGVCRAEDEAEIDSAVTLQTVSTIGLIAGGLATAAGVVLIVVRPGGDDAPAVAIDAGPSYLGLRGRF